MKHTITNTLNPIISPDYLQYCELDAPLIETHKLSNRDKRHLDKLRRQNRLRRVMSKYQIYLPVSHPSPSEGYSSHLGFKWSQQPVDILFGNRNLPPLINQRAVDPVLKYILTLISEIAGNVGGVMFIIGSYCFYPKYEESCGSYACPMYGAVLFTLGSFLFFVGSCVNFYKNDAMSCQDIALTINATLYLVANFMFVIGSIFFVPIIEENGFGLSGVSLFIIGSFIFIVAPLYDMHRAHQLRGKVQISFLSYVIECIVASLYIGGSCLFLVGSILYLPELYDPFSVTLFVVGSFFFLGATISSPAANIWRYFDRLARIRRIDSEVQLDRRSRSTISGNSDTLSVINSAGDLQMGRKRPRDNGVYWKNGVLSKQATADLKTALLPPGTVLDSAATGHMERYEDTPVDVDHGIRISGDMELMRPRYQSENPLGPVDPLFIENTSGTAVVDVMEIV
mmetsp:Transcript_16750/g.25153  ORF Transcript_16750/g.25153 Transcript_16750/m.25153 type:complete len:454 (-) Transcript_16750:196-1557(-)